MNPYFVILVIFSLMGIAWTYYMDGEPMPHRHYNIKATVISTLIHLFLVYSAIMWAVAHA